MLSGVPVDWSTLRALLIDLDGVVYAGRDPIPGAAGFLADARQHGRPFLLITNNSTASPQEVAARLGGMGIEVRPDDILTSAQVAAAYVRAHGEPEARVRVIGEAGLRQAVREVGLRLVEDGAPTVDWVVAGLDREFDYAKLTAATRDILAGARFLATNADALLPVEGGDVLPGAGTIVAAIQTATGSQPVVVGKPEPGLFEHALVRLGVPRPEQAVMIGDRLDTDVTGGQRAGLRTVLVLSGVTGPQQLATGGPRPDAVLPNLAAMARLLGWR